MSTRNTFTKSVERNHLGAERLGNRTSLQKIRDSPTSLGMHSNDVSVLLFRIAAALCFLAVALGAFGAHGLRSTLESRGMVDVWNKAVFYQFIHAIALLVLALYGSVNRGAWWLLFAGIVLFSGSLYLLALTSLALVGRCYSRGRSLFPCGWAWLFLAPPK